MRGWAASLLIEKDELTSGSTWHAAGAITHSLGNAGLARMAGYGIELYQRTAYAVWTGIGAIGTFLAGIHLFGDSTAIVRWLGVALIAGGGIVTDLRPENSSKNG